MSTTTYVFVEKYERYQQFSDEKSALSVAMFLAMKCTINIPKRPPLYSAYFPYALADLDDFMCQAAEYCAYNNQN